MRWRGCLPVKMLMHPDGSVAVEVAACRGSAVAGNARKRDSFRAHYLPQELRLPEGMPYEHWVAVGQALRGMTEHIQWWWGDWVSFGERAYGEKYSQAVDDTGLKPQTLMNMAWVASRFQVSRRREVSWSHHADVAALEPQQQDEWPGRVQAGNWTRQQLREELRRARRLAAAATPIPTGLYATIVIDPPWPYEERADDDTHRGRLPYPSMSLDDIGAIKIPAAEDCILWLWTTNAFMHEAFHVLDAWGFEHKGILTWEKDRMGLGSWLRNQTEHCLLAVRGKPKVTLTNRTTILHGPRREHSRKPDEFFDLVEALCPEPRLEMFARQQRPGWTVHGNETDKFS
jgi:N6-adenosine-specific RNA methylase IME4